MALDPSIALQIRPMADPMEAMGKAVSLRALATQNELQGMQVQQQRDALARQTRLRDLVAGLPADASDDQRLSAMRGGGFLDEADKFEDTLLKRRRTNAEIGKFDADAGETRAKTAEKQFEVQRRRVEAGAAVVGSVLARTQNPTHQDIFDAIAQAAQQYGLTPDEQSAMARGLPGDPAALSAWLRSTNAQLMGAKERMEMLTPKLQEVNLGGTTQLVDVNPNTRGAAPTTFQRTVTPDAQLQANVTMRGQNMTDARARAEGEATRAAQVGQVTWQQDANGNFVALPTRVPAGQPAAGIQPIPALGPDGKPVRGKGGDLTEGQAKAMLFGGRMQEADATLRRLAQQGDERASSIKTTVENVPVVGPVLGGAANMALGVLAPGAQQVEQAQRDFINAVLRRESGAVIADSEFDNARKQYFPQPGDSDAVKSQKAANRQRAIQLMLEEVPTARRGAIAGATPAQPAAGARPAPPKVGDVVDGYLFNGGDPANQSSWKKVR